MTPTELTRAGAKDAGSDGRALGVAVWLVGLLVALITLAVFQESLGGDFVQWDDDINIYCNPHIQKLDEASVRWMFTDCSYTPRYRPLNWLSWALTYRLFGTEPFGFHLGDLLLHTVNMVLVYWLIRHLLARFAFPAAVSRGWTVPVCAGIGALWWSIHPLRVEAVAWANGRIYTQSACFLLFSLICYLHSAARAPAVPSLRSCRYWLAVGLFALSLLTYPTGLPFVLVLLILNVYPLGRLPPGVRGWAKDPGARRVWLELVPFALVTLPVAAITVWARMQATGFWADTAVAQSFGWASRLSQACYIWAYYLWRPWLPFHLSPTYTTLVAFQPAEPRFLLSGAVLLAITALLFRIRRRTPLLWALWLCHLSLLIPMLGLIEPRHTANDRYSYLPAMLWSVLLAYGLWRLWPRPKLRVAALTVTCAGAVLLGRLSERQTKVWRNSEVLFRHIIAGLGNDPYRDDIHWRLGVYLAGQGRVGEAIEQFEAVLRISPEYVDAHESLAEALLQQGKPAKAISHYETALRLRPGNARAHEGLGRVLFATGRAGEAIRELERALQLRLDFDDARQNLRAVLAQLGSGLAAQGKWAEAIVLYERAVQLKPDDAQARAALGQALSQAGRFAEGIRATQSALELARAAGQTNLAGQMQERLMRYQAGQP